LLNQSMSSLHKHKKNFPKLIITWKQKNLFELKYGFLGDFRLKKHLILTLLVI